MEGKFSAKSEANHYDDFIIYSLPHNMTKNELLSGLRKCVNITEQEECLQPIAGYSDRQPTLITHCLVLKIFSTDLLRKLQDNFPVYIRKRLIYYRSYCGELTELEIEAEIKELTVYITGIPIKADYCLILSTIREMVHPIELHIPQNHINNYKYYGFIICKDVSDYETLLSQKKIQIPGKCKIQFKKLNYHSYKNRLTTSLTTKTEVLIKKKGLKNCKNVKSALMACSFFRGRHSFINLLKDSIPHKKKMVLEKFLDQKEFVDCNNNKKSDNFRYNRVSLNEE